MDYREVHLDTLNSGAVADLFEEEFGRLIKNIADENTEPDKTRTISIKVTVKPSKDRSKADTKVSVSSSLAPLKPHESFIVFSNDGDRIKAFTTDIRQPDLPMGENIIPLNKAGGQ